MTSTVIPAELTKPQLPPVDQGASAGYLPILESLLKLYRGLNKSQITWSKDHDAVAHIAHGWYMRCLRQAEAVIALDNLGYAEEASPLRRSIIEHSVALIWLGVEGNKIEDTLARGHAKITKDIQEAAETANWQSIDGVVLSDIIAQIDPDSRDRSNDHFLNFHPRLEEYGDPGGAVLYVVECAKTHPCYESAATYMDSQSRLMLTPESNLWQTPFLATHLLEATIAFAATMDPNPLEEDLASIEQQFKEVANRVRVEQGLEPIDWAAAASAAP